MGKFDKKIIKERIKIDNSRMLFDLMNIMYKEFEIDKNAKWDKFIYDGKGGLKSWKEKIGTVRDYVKEKVENAYDFNTKTYYYFNKITRQLKFYKDNYATSDDENTIVNELGDILYYFATITYIYNNSLEKLCDNIPYLYESLLLSIKKISKCDIAQIVYTDKIGEHKLVWKSDDVWKSNELLIQPEFREWKSILSNEENNSEIPNVFLHEKCELIRDSKVRHEFDCIVIRLQNKFDLDLEDKINQGENKDMPIIGFKDNYFDLVLYYYDDNSIEDYINIIYRIIFMRFRLTNILIRDYDKLINYRYDYSYIKSIEDIDNLELPKIIHISDAHIDLFNGENAIKFIEKYFENKDNKLENFDLLCATGDIVNCSDNSLDCQKKYEKFWNIICLFAKNLWASEVDNTKDTQIMPHDWKRRLLFIPGNHDYTAMNDVTIEVESRKIKSGQPSKSLGGVLSRFTYYIEFLAKYLDTPIVKIVDSKLNEIREYKNLKIIVGAFNTVSHINSLRTNKVSFFNHLDTLLDMNIWDSEKLHIVLTHHRPDYNINYLEDIYELWNYGDGNRKMFIELLKLWTKIFANDNYYDFIKDKIDEIMKEINKMKVSFDGTDNNENDDTDNPEKLFYSQIYNDMNIFKNVLSKINENEVLNDYDTAFLDYLHNQVYTQQNDQKEFNKLFNNIILNRKIDKNYVCLCGHEHKNYDKNNVHVLDKFIKYVKKDKKIGINFGKLEPKIGKNGVEYVYNRVIYDDNHTDFNFDLVGK